MLTHFPGSMATSADERACSWPAQGKCTPLRFEWKDSAVNVGKLMRYELVRELQDAGPDVEVECTGEPAELTELKVKDEVWPQGTPRFSAVGSILRLVSAREDAWIGPCDAPAPGTCARLSEFPQCGSMRGAVLRAARRALLCSTC